jgi:hypothetical protein
VLRDPDRTNTRKQKSPACAGLFWMELQILRLAAPGADKARDDRRSWLFAGGHFFGFAFLAHLLQFAFGFFPGGLHFLLDFGCRFFQFR